MRGRCLAVNGRGEDRRTKESGGIVCLYAARPPGRHFLLAAGGPSAVQKDRAASSACTPHGPPGGIFCWRLEGHPPYKRIGRHFLLAAGGPSAVQEAGLSVRALTNGRGHSTLRSIPRLLGW